MRADLRLDLPGTPDAVRMALVGLMADPALACLSADARGTLEIVLAEALNNVVEHAYAGTAGRIALHLIRHGPGIAVEIADSGRPMPGLRPPAGQPCPTGADLPEGGFGWFLIRSLTAGLSYERRANRNLLRFHLAPDAGPSTRIVSPAATMT